MPNVPSNRLYNEDDLDVVQKAWQVPWEPFHLVIPNMPSSINYGWTQCVSRARPKHQVIGDNLNAQETSWPPRLSSVRDNKAPDSYFQTTRVPTATQASLLPMSPAPAFEVRSSVTPLTHADFTPQSATSFHMAHDENPFFLTTDYECLDDNDDNFSADKGPVIPAPNNRGARELFAVSQDDEEATPRHKRVLDEAPPSPPVSETGSNRSSGSAKGWARLRPMAPLSIKNSSIAAMDGVVGVSTAEKSSASAAFEVTGADKRQPGSLAASIHRVRLLRILNRTQD
ncbi:hypothetical protein C0991_008558 [Blastosporella zonata]|nr:hypothetical protein C0991_008558 [Blastosporella zonata]